MNRRGLLKGLLGLLAAPFIPKAIVPVPKYEQIVALPFDGKLLTVHLELDHLTNMVRKRYYRADGSMFGDETLPLYDYIRQCRWPCIPEREIKEVKEC